jgi:hypothetical protein
MPAPLDQGLWRKEPDMMIMGDHERAVVVDAVGQRKPNKTTRRSEW